MMTIWVCFLILLLAFTDNSDSWPSFSQMKPGSAVHLHWPAGRKKYQHTMTHAVPYCSNLQMKATIPAPEHAQEPFLNNNPAKLHSVVYACLTYVSHDL